MGFPFFSTCRQNFLVLAAQSAWLQNGNNASVYSDGANRKKAGSVGSSGLNLTSLHPSKGSDFTWANGLASAAALLKVRIRLLIQT